MGVVSCFLYFLLNQNANIRRKLETMKQVYLVLAALMLLCLAPMPYGYFQLVRLLSTIAFAVMAFRYYRERKEWMAYTFGVLALLFQPFYKIALGDRKSVV